jgi:hypothetical protein
MDSIRHKRMKIFMLAEVIRTQLTNIKIQPKIITSKCTFVRVGGAYGDGYQEEAAQAGSR